MIHKIIVPEGLSVNVTFDVPQDYIGKEMEIIAFIKNEGLEKGVHSEYLSPALKGEPMTIEEFQDWIADAEKSPTISFDEMKERWEIKKKEILERIKLG